MHDQARFQEEEEIKTEGEENEISKESRRAKEARGEEGRTLLGYVS